MTKNKKKQSRLGEDNYKDKTKLSRRKSFYKNYVKPKIDFKEEVLKVLELKGNERILDIGCGFGDFLINLKDKGHKGDLIGIDISEGMIKEALSMNKNIRFFVANAEKLPFGKKEFDVILCKHMLYHVNDIKKALKEVNRTLKDDGLFVITLNTLTHHSREHVEYFKKLLSKKLKSKFLDNNNVINLENYERYTNDFYILKELKFFMYLKIKKSKPIVEYMDTIREFYYPIPKNNEWKAALEVISKEVKREINYNGIFNETLGNGIILLRKKLK